MALGGEKLARVERDALGREVARTAGAVTQTQAFDPQGRLAAQRGVAGGGRAVFSRTYGYDAADQLVRVEDEARGTRAYQYDALERLLAVDGSAPERFVVDPAGNLLAAADAADATDGGAGGPADAPTDGADVAPGDRLGRFRGRAGERTFRYDAWGNRVRERRPDGSEVVYRYGADDVLREVRTSGRDGARVTRFGYDALGRRVWKAAARLTGAATLAVAGAGAPANAAALLSGEPPAAAWTRTAFVWSGDVLLAESERPGEDALATVYAYEPGTFRPLAVVKRDDAGADAAVYRYHVDHLGTPQELTDAAGAVAWRAEYRAWGALAREAVAEVAQPLRFPGQYADHETGLHYNRHRYYSPGEGRFVTQDPIGLAGGLNVAAYAPNPLAWVDPLGLTGNPLLPGEGDVGTYGDLRRAGSPGDNLTPHHIPSDAYMKGKGIPGYTRDEGIAINMEQPHPGAGGRHRATASYGTSPDLSLTPREMLARDVADARSVYMRDGQYTPEVRKALQGVIAENEKKWPGTFDKPCGF